MEILQKNQIRIGNYFIYVDSFDCRENDDINQISESDFGDDDDCWDRKIPILLSEEWLLKFGFIQDKGIMCYRSEIDESIQIIYETLANYYRLYPRTNPIKYVHELQNLYFALTGEELQVTS